MTFEREREGGLSPSTHSIELRKRKRDICHLIHNSAWLIETFSILFIIVFHFLIVTGEAPYVIKFISFIINLITAKIFVPFSYLFNENRIKILILEKGWVFAIKNALRLKSVSTVAPEQDLQLQNCNKNRKRLQNNATTEETQEPKILMASNKRRCIDTNLGPTMPQNISYKKQEQISPKPCNYFQQDQDALPGQVNACQC